jgi:hypothetical protein
MKAETLVLAVVELMLPEAAEAMLVVQEQMPEVVLAAELELAEMLAVAAEMQVAAVPEQVEMAMA